MKKDKPQKTIFFMSLLLAAMTIVVGVSFIIAVAEVYYGGIHENAVEPPFTAARIGKVVVVPMILLFVWIAAVIVVGILSFAYSKKERKTQIDKDTVLLRLKKLPLVANKENFALKRMEEARMIVRLAAGSIMFAAAIGTIVTVFSRVNYVATAASLDLLYLLRDVLILMSVAFAACIAACIYEGYSVGRRIALIKQIYADNAKAADPAKAPADADHRAEKKRGANFAIAFAATIGVGLFAALPSIFKAMSLNGVDAANVAAAAAIFVVMIAAAILGALYKDRVSLRAEKIIIGVTRTAVAVVAVTFIIVGVFNGGAHDVLTKAINICTECIGLG